MRYELRLATADRRRYTLRGIKEIVRRRWFPTALWDTTTLFVDIWAGDEMAGRPKLRGVLTMGPGAVLMQGLSFRGAGSWFGLGAIVRFMRYYLARCAHVYLGPRTAPIRPQWSAVEAAGAAGN
jgi:hypothetical protein